MILRDGIGWVLRDGKVQNATPVDYVAEIERMKTRVLQLEEQVKQAEWAARLNADTIKQIQRGI